MPRDGVGAKRLPGSLKAIIQNFVDIEASKCQSDGRSGDGETTDSNDNGMCHAKNRFCDVNIV